MYMNTYLQFIPLKLLANCIAKQLQLPDGDIIPRKTNEAPSAVAS